jgi:heme/copper-type cytochrome/quinol oxidase subunit 2
MQDNIRTNKPHPTTRRGFIVLCGFAVVSLYGLWASYGAVPTRLGTTKQSMQARAPGMESGQNMDSHIPVEEFRRLAQAFVDANMLPDGSVKPVIADRAGASSVGAYISEPVEVYVMARQYSYWPAVLRLRRNTPYRFRIMAMDTDHGASIQFKGAAYMIRARAEHVVEKVLVFREPGEYPIYCTVYCGVGHDLMKGKIIVE